MTAIDRPDIWIGHVVMHTRTLNESEHFMKQVGLRAITRTGSIAVLEFRGGTHIVLIEDSEAQPADAKFDFMVEELDLTYENFKTLGLNLSKIERGDIHDSFVVTEPGGNRIVVNSTHVENHNLV